MISHSMKFKKIKGAVKNKRSRTLDLFLNLKIRS